MLSYNDLKGSGYSGNANVLGWSLKMTSEESLQANNHLSKYQVGKKILTWFEESSSVAPNAHSEKLIIFSRELNSPGVSLYRTIDYLPHFYTMRNPVYIYQFLENNFKMICALYRIPALISKHFGMGQKLVLEVVPDPESEDTEQLFIFIETELDPVQATQKLNELDQDWFENNELTDLNNLCIHVEYL